MYSEMLVLMMDIMLYVISASNEEPVSLKEEQNIKDLNKVNPSKVTAGKHNSIVLLLFSLQEKSEFQNVIGLWEKVRPKKIILSYNAYMH